MNNPFFSSLVQRAHGFHCGFAGGVNITALDGHTRTANLLASSTAVNAIVKTTFLVLSISFDCRFYISQVKPPKLG